MNQVDVSVAQTKYKMFVDERDTLGLSHNHMHEPSLSRFFANTIQPGDICVDVGAMIGYYTILFALLATNKGVVTAFEPDKDNYDILLKNISLNGCGGMVLPVNKAVLNTKGDATLFHCDVHDGGHSTFAFEDCPLPTAQISSIRLDDYYGDNANIDIIKIDIQGSEIQALLGMTNLLESSPDVILTIEYEPWLLQQAGEDPKDLLDILSRLDFKFFTPRGKLLTIPEIQKKVPEVKNHHINLVCRR